MNGVTELIKELMMFTAAEFREALPALDKQEKRTALDPSQVKQIASSNLQLVVTALVAVNNTSGLPKGLSATLWKNSRGKCS